MTTASSKKKNRSLRKLKKKLLYPIICPVAYLVLILFSFLPYFFIKLIAKVLSRIVLIASSKSRKIIQTNLDIAFPEKTTEEKKKILLKSSENMVLTILETVWIPRKINKIKQLVEIAPQIVDELKEIQSNGQGIILVTPHLGNWEAGSLALSANGIKMSVVAQEVHIPIFEKLITDCRQKLGAKLIHADGAARGILKALKSGQAIGFLMDQNTKIEKGGQFCDFFGLQVPTTKLPIAMKKHTKCAIKVIVFARKNGKFVTKLVPLNQNIDNQTDDQLLQSLISANEQIIKKYPEQWCWLYKRFRYIPSDATEEQKAKYPFYAKRK